MYNGYVEVAFSEVVNTHRAAAYAAQAGLPWVKGCDQCHSITAAHGQTYLTPMRDAAAGDPPPWWGDGSDPDALEFLGVMGISVQNVDDSTRDISTISRAGGGGFIGGLTYQMRSIVVRAVAIAASDCALGFGLEWLRGMDSAQSCANTQVDMYDCCPNLTLADCNDPACTSACVFPRLRSFYDARVTEGPTVLRRREMSRGAMAEIEFTITCGDPGIYAPGGVNVGYAIPDSARLIEPRILPPPEPVDLFAVPRPEPIVPLVPVERTMPERLQWLRQEMPLERPQFGAEIAPSITLIPSDGYVEDVRVALVRDSVPVMSVRIPALPQGGEVRIDYRTRRIYTRSNDGPERVNYALARAADGSRLVWPKSLPNSGQYTLFVDRAAGNAVEVGAVLVGRAQP
jgi:hypothetical protein